MSSVLISLCDQPTLIWLQVSGPWYHTRQEYKSWLVINDRCSVLDSLSWISVSSCVKIRHRHVSRFQLQLMVTGVLCNFHSKWELLRLAANLFKLGSLLAFSWMPKSRSFSVFNQVLRLYLQVLLNWLQAHK